MIRINSESAQHGVIIEMPHLGTVELDCLDGVEGAWLRCRDDLLGIVKQPEFTFPYVMASCETQPRNLSLTIPDILIYHDPVRGLLIQIPDEDRGSRTVPYAAAMMALRAIPD